MKIKIVMHSQLDEKLKPDFELIKNALQNIKEGNTCKNIDALYEFEKTVGFLQSMEKREQSLAQEIQSETDPQNKADLITYKKALANTCDELLEKALESLAVAGGGDLYHYNYDLHFNRIVAGLMGSTCYMKDTFDDLRQKGIKNILAIASTVETNGHHSTFGHSHLTLEIDGIPKALAMVLNNEKEYCTSEKSGRYTIMKDVEPTQNELYEKWKDILTKKISAKYGNRQPFFDERGIKATKLAQENARYMISVFTPTSMVYTTSFRQLNYIAHWLEDVINDQNVNEFYAQIKPQMAEFVQFVKDNNLYSDKLDDNKGRKLSLFGEGLFKEVLTDSVYALANRASLACLAQLQRHRTIHYNIDEFEFVNMPKRFYTPPILSKMRNKNLAREWEKDIQSVEESYPQGMLVSFVEKGETSDFLLKANERLCICAQKEIRDLTQADCGKFAAALKAQANLAAEEANTLSQIANCMDIGFKKYSNLRAQKQSQIASKISEDASKFEKLSHGARCTAGYKCASPCKFPEGVNLDCDV